MTGTLDPIFVVSNRVEAALWLAIALAFGIAAVRRASVRADCITGAITFALFGVSDLVETATGAWWRPWWLLAWKGGCVAVFLWLLARHARGRRRLKLKIKPDL